MALTEGERAALAAILGKLSPEDLAALAEDASGLAPGPETPPGIGGPVLVEVIDPELALSDESRPLTLAAAEAEEKFSEAARADRAGVFEEGISVAEMVRRQSEATHPGNAPDGFPEEPDDEPCPTRGGRWRVTWRLLDGDPDREGHWQIFPPRRKSDQYPRSIGTAHRDGPILSTTEPYEGPLCDCELGVLRGIPGVAYSAAWRFDVEDLDGAAPAPEERPRLSLVS